MVQDQDTAKEANKLCNDSVTFAGVLYYYSYRITKHYFLQLLNNNCRGWLEVGVILPLECCGLQLQASNTYYI